MVNEDPFQTHLTIGDEQINTTPEHPFYTWTRGWVAASALRVGDRVRQLDGSYATVQQVVVDATPRLMYNLTVDVAHTFFVGEDGWLVHNAGKCFRPGGYRQHDIAPHGDLSNTRPGWRATGFSHSPADGRIESHHIIQNEWAKANIPGYNRDDAPAILLRTGRGEEHTYITNVQGAEQRARIAAGQGPWSSTFREEVNGSYRMMIGAGVPRRTAQSAINHALEYFATLGIHP